MKINKQELAKALETVRPGLANKEMIEQSTSFAFMDGRVVTYNDKISISHPVPNLDLTGAVKAEQLYKFLAKLNKDEIDLSIKENEIQLKAGKAKAGLALQEEIKLPLEEIGETGKWKKAPDGLKNVMKFAMFSCSSDMSRPVLTCVYVGKAGDIVSCDNYRVTKCTTKKSPVNSFLIPARSVKELVRYDFTHIAEGDGWMHFKTQDETIFSCRLVGDNYPDVTGLLDVKGKQVKLPSSLEDVLDRAMIFSKRDHALDELINVKIAEKRVKIQAEGDSGWFEEQSPTKYTDDPLNFKINPNMLKDIIKHTQTCSIGDNCVKFEGDDWEHIVALVQE